MSKLGIYTGTSPNDNTGDSLLSAAIKINKNFDEIYTFLGEGSTDTLSAPLWSKTSVGINTLRNVGIGTTNPSSTLTVLGNVSISGVLTSSSGQMTSLMGTNLNYSGVSTVGSLSIGSTQVISSGRELQNITSLDAITISTIESAIQSAPNDFSNLNVSGISTLGNTVVGGATTQLMVNGDARITGVITASSFIGNATSSSYAVSAGIATYANSAGISTVSQGLTGSPNILVGITTISILNVGLGGTVITTTSDGLVGINSTSPTKILDVIGDIKVGINTSQGVILTSPNGTQFRLIIDDSGTLSTVAI